VNVDDILVREPRLPRERFQDDSGERVGQANRIDPLLTVGQHGCHTDTLGRARKCEREARHLIDDQRADPSIVTCPAADSGHQDIDGVMIAYEAVTATLDIAAGRERVDKRPVGDRCEQQTGVRVGRRTLRSVWRFVFGSEQRDHLTADETVIGGIKRISDVGCGTVRRVFGAGS
jgi:hypothetical protein